jgi:undecaprenyl-diphosphatase
LNAATWIQAVVLGIVQGLTEFIPVSSSGHLVLAPHLLGWDKPSLAFDVALHMGTVGAILVYFRGELWGMARSVVQGSRAPDGALYRRLILLLALASVPVALAGLLVADVVEDAFGSPLVTSILLFGTAALLVGGERWRDRRVARAREAATVPPGREHPADVAPAGQPAPDDRTLATGRDASDPTAVSLDRMGPKEALVMGCAQMLALFPGISRSGATIMLGVVGGMSREAATRFSFLMALPALLGAMLLSIGDLSEVGRFSATDIALGVLASFVSGYLAIRFLVALVSRERLTGFAIYVCVLGAIGVATSLLG